MEHVKEKEILNKFVTHFREREKERTWSGKIFLKQEVEKVSGTH